MYKELDERLKTMKGIEEEEGMELLRLGTNVGNGNNVGIMKIDWNKIEKRYLSRKLVKKIIGNERLSLKTKEEIEETNRC